MYHQLQHPHELTKTLRHSVFWTHAGPAWWSLSLRDLVRNMIDGELSTRARGLARANNGGRQVASSGTSTYTEGGWIKRKEAEQTDRSLMRLGTAGVFKRCPDRSSIPDSVLQICVFSFARAGRDDPATISRDW